MPYVPSRKTNRLSDDREVLDIAVEEVARYAASRITNNLSLIWVYRSIFVDLARTLRDFVMKVAPLSNKKEVERLAQAIQELSDEYGYEGAYLGELNYSITRLIQRVPQLKVRAGDWPEEFRYWIYACTVDALIWASCKTHNFGTGVSGVFEDVKDEYKRRVNSAYEAAQIVKNGDCYSTPYYSRLVEVVDEAGYLIGHQEIMLKREMATLDNDLLDVQIVVRNKKSNKPLD